ncbi:MAG: proton-conducting transporter membrane subunit [Gammaproteobacteria bacterium]|nr:proton-conducting transporter membrane subunit [Gammaproteobacteria bacterium]
MASIWAVTLVLLPLAGVICCFLLPRISRTLGLFTSFANLISVSGLGWQLLEHGSYRHAVGGWGAPLGIELYADGLSLLMLATTAMVGFAISVYSTAYFKPAVGVRFWPIWLCLLTALNTLFLSADIFNLYVTLELMGLSAVALTALTGSKEALNGAMRYLLASLLASLSYLLGVVLLYHSFGSVDISLLTQQMQAPSATLAAATPAVWAALGLMGAGLMLKTAIFPLHFWLPPAHGSAPAPVSALLSALVIKASFYILLRLWFTLFEPLVDGEAINSLLGLLGCAAILWGSVQAIRQTRLKLLIAYSTVAQIGYLFLVFPLASNMGSVAWNAIAYLIISHALAKSAMFLCAGNLLRFGGHDRIADLDRVVQRLPLTAAAFALAGVSIMGIPPSGGFIGKWLLLETAIIQGRWDLVAVIIIGGLLAAVYIFKVIGYTFSPAQITHEAHNVSARMQWSALLLAIGAVLLGFLSLPVLSLLNISDATITSGVGL